MRGRPRKVTTACEASALPAVAQPASQEIGSVSTESVPAHHREHPDKISGQALRDLAHRKGMAKSELTTMSDDKIRTQLKFIDYRRASEDAVV
jgi:hypothetical protein